MSIKCFAIGIPVSCAGIAITWAIKKYRESYLDQNSKNGESQPVNEAQNANVPASKEPVQIRKEIKIHSDALTGKIEDNGECSKSCESITSAVEATVEAEDRRDGRPNPEFRRLLAPNWLTWLTGLTYSNSKCFYHWVTNIIPTKSQVIIFKEEFIKSVTAKILSIIAFCYHPASKEPVQIRKEIKVDRDNLTDKSKDNDASSKSCGSINQYNHTIKSKPLSLKNRAMMPTKRKTLRKPLNFTIKPLSWTVTIWSIIQMSQQCFLNRKNMTNAQIPA
jgi:hypothetical protein